MDALIVSRAEAGQKLLNFLTRRTTAAASELHKWIRSGQVRLNGGRVKAFARVAEGDAVRVPPFAALRVPELDGNILKSPPKGANAEDTPLDAVSPGLLPPIVYENDELLVLNKPAGLPSQGGSGHSDSAASRLARAYARADFVPALVHRLDKDTSGLLLAGKTYAAVRGLTDALAGRDGVAPVKEYLAWVWGTWPHTAVRELRDRLSKDEAARRMRVGVDAGNDKGREALSLAVPAAVRETRECGAASLLLVRLVSGRTHQIRVQLAARGFPLVGDPRYGDAERDARAGADGLKLHACRLFLPPPWSRRLEAAPDWGAPWNIPPAHALPSFPELQP